MIWSKQVQCSSTKAWINHQQKMEICCNECRSELGKVINKESEYKKNQKWYSRTTKKCGWNRQSTLLPENYSFPLFFMNSTLVLSGVCIIRRKGLNVNHQTSKMCRDFMIQAYWRIRGESGISNRRNPIGSLEIASISQHINILSIFPTFQFLEAMGTPGAIHLDGVVWHGIQAALP